MRLQGVANEGCQTADMICGGAGRLNGPPLAGHHISSKNDSCPRCRQYWAVISPACQVLPQRKPAVNAARSPASHGEESPFLIRQREALMGE